MKKIITSFASLLLVVSAASAVGPVYISEIMANPPGADSSAAQGNEMFELRGPPNMSLAGYYLISVEGQVAGNLGDINQYFDLGAFSLGANGYLFAREANSKYTAVDPAAYLVANTISTNWGNINSGIGSTAGHYGDGTQGDLENGATTILLVNIGTGSTPTLTTDLDTDNDGVLDLPAGWTISDSVGLMDGNTPLATDRSYGAITFRVAYPAGNYAGTNVQGNVIDVPGVYTSSAGSLYVGRKGESTGSTTNDWVGTIVDGGSAANPLGFMFASPTDSSFTGVKLSDMKFGGKNLEVAPPGTLPYTPTINGARFTTNTIVTPLGPVGDIAIDPRDNTTILYTIDNYAGSGGGIYRAYKVASGNWWLDSTPVVTGLDRPKGMVIGSDGTLWWVHLYAGSLMRLQAPWSANTPEMVITNTGFGTIGLDDDPIDLAFAPASFSSHPGWLVIADEGSDSDAYNALNLLDPATTELNQVNNNFLVAPTTASLGWDNVRAIDALPQSGEVVTLSTDGYISAVDGSGTIRTIFPTTVVVTNGECLAVDPTTGRVWVGDDSLNEIWSVDPAASGQTPDIKELTFPLKPSSPAFWAIDMHSPGMAFSTNGAFLVVSDTSTVGGGGRFIVFHSESYAPFALSSFSITNVTQTVSGPKLEWSLAGPASFNLKYVIQRSTNLGDAGSFSTIATVTANSYTDTSAPPVGAFYRVLAKP